MANIYPDKEAEFVDWSENFRDKTTATPLVFSLTAPQALSYSTKHDDFIAKRAVALNPATRSSMNIEIKDASKRILQDEARLLAGIVQRAQNTTNAMRIDLRIPERDLGPTPIPAPTVVPVIKVRSVNGYLIDVSVTTAESTRRGLPDGVAGINIYTSTAAVPPTDPNDWTFEGESSKARFSIQAPETLPVGSKFHVVCCFKSPRFQTGPACGPTTVILGGGVPETSVG